MNFFSCIVFKKYFITLTLIKPYRSGDSVKVMLLCTFWSQGMSGPPGPPGPPVSNVLYFNCG